MAMRAVLIQADAELLTQKACSKQLRNSADGKYSPNQSAQVWDLSRRCWANGSRFISDTGRNAILEANGKLIKIPLAWIRPQLVSGTAANVIAVSPAADHLDSRPSNSLSPSGAPKSCADGSSLSVPSAPLGSSEGSSTTKTRVLPLPFKRYNLRSAGMSSLDQTGLLYADWIFYQPMTVLSLPTIILRRSTFPHRLIPSILKN